MDLIISVVDFMKELLIREKVFLSFAFVLLSVQSLALYALFVSHTNKSIMMCRRRKGLVEVRQTQSAVFKIMNSHFLTLAKDTFGGDYFNRKETAIYRYLITLAMDERKPIYEKRIELNHFNEKTPAEWKKYVDDCIADDIAFITEYLDTHYHPQARIQRPDLYEWNKSVVSRIEKELEGLFDELLHIAEQNKLRRFFGVKIEIGGL